MLGFLQIDSSPTPISIPRLNVDSASARIFRQSTERDGTFRTARLFNTLQQQREMFANAHLCRQPANMASMPQESLLVSAIACEISDRRLKAGEILVRAQHDRQLSHIAHPKATNGHPSSIQLKFPHSLTTRQASGKHHNRT